MYPIGNNSGEPHDKKTFMELIKKQKRKLSAEELNEIVSSENFNDKRLNDPNIEIDDDVFGK